MRTRYAILSMVSVVGYFILASFLLSEPLPNRIAEDPTIKGKGKAGKCMDYALAVSSKLYANGIHGLLMFYRFLLLTVSRMFLRAERFFSILTDTAPVFS